MSFMNILEFFLQKKLQIQYIKLSNLLSLGHLQNINKIFILGWFRFTENL